MKAAYWSADSYVPGTPAVVLGTAAAGGSAGTGLRTDCTIVAFDTTDPSTQALGDTAVVGSVAKAARRDHKHAMPSEATVNSLAVAAVNAAGIILATAKSVEIKKVLTGDHTVSGITVTLTAGENFTLFQVGYLKSDGKIWLSDADAIATMPVLYIATAAISADTAGIFMKIGFAYDASWNWTVGGKLYASGTAGAITQTAPTGSLKVVQIVGFAHSATIIEFCPMSGYLELA